MSEVTLYDSRGYPLDDPNGERNEKIRNMSRYGVVFTISYTQPYEMATYFRAYESASGRMEQYYATYTTASNRALLREFREAVIAAAEEDHGLEIERSESGENILSNLDADDPGQIGTDRQRSRARELLSGGERLRFGVGSYEKAFKLIGELAGARPGMEFAVTEGESTTTGPMSTYDLVIEKGSHMGLEPLGQTQARMNPDPVPSNAADEDPRVALAVDVGYGMAAVVLVVLIYAATASLLFSFGGPALPLAEEVRWSHSITVNDGSSPISVKGSTPAENLTLEYVDRNGEPIETDTIPVEKNRVEYPIRSVPANTSSIRVRYEGLLSWRLASSKSLSDVPRYGNTDSTDTPTASPTTSPTSTTTSPTSTTTSPTSTTTSPTSTTTSPTPTNTSTPTTSPTSTNAAIDDLFSG